MMELINRILKSLVLYLLSSNYVSTKYITEIISYSGKANEWNIPIGVNIINFSLNGASGQSMKVKGGLGATVIGTLNVSGISVLYLFVGGEGHGGFGGFNGGKDSGNSNCTCCGGGGASEIRIGGYNLTDRVAVAGGGGGARSFRGIVILYISYTIYV